MNGKKAKAIRKLVDRLIQKNVIIKNNILEGGTIRADNKLSPLKYSKDSPRRVYKYMKRAM